MSNLKANIFYKIGILHSVAHWKLTPILFCLSYWREKVALYRVVQSGTGQSTLRL